MLAALGGGDAMTAGQVADKTGLARPTVSTTLSKLANSGEAQKAEPGYRLAPAAARCRLHPCGRGAPGGSLPEECPTCRPPFETMLSCELERSAEALAP